MPLDRQKTIRALFDEYIEMYAGRDDRLTTRFSDNFSGYTGGGDFLVKNREAWVKITRLDFSQVPGRIRIEMLDFSMQDVSDNVVVTTAFFHIHLPVPEQVLSKEVARLVLIFRLEGDEWKIVHSGISIPYHGVQDGEVYPLKNLQQRNSDLEALVEARTQALNESQALYRLLTEDAQDVIWKTDGNLVITYISPADERLRGFKAEEVIGRHVFEMFNDEGIAVVKSVMQQRQNSTDPDALTGFLTFEVQHRCRDGRLIWGEVRSKPERNAEGEIVGYHGITREITERKILEDQVRQFAFHDPLTGLPNRRLFNDRLKQVMATNKRTRCYGALLFLDLDNFKPVNDMHGHEVGDLLLVEVANRLRTCVREMDSVARFGGDEFVVMLSELDLNEQRSAAHARKVAEKISKFLSEPYVLLVKQSDTEATTVEHHCTVSLGLTLFKPDETNINNIIKRADIAMYEAKATGPNMQ
jgi:diguanylate cyclase (GGDEF)-like protein/PAS domain S-box-containing protein